MKPQCPAFGKFGFTMIEVLTALMIISVVTRHSIPHLQDVRLKAEAARMVGDFEVAKVAVFQYNADTNLWPQDLGPGRTPPELAPYLPEGFTFNRGRYQLDWENWILPRGLPNHPDARSLAGVSIVTADRALGSALEELLGPNSASFSLAGSYTFLLGGM